MCNPLTPTINISTEHEETGDTIKTVLEGSDPKLAGALTVAGALQQKKGMSYMCGENGVKERHCSAVRLVRPVLTTCQGSLVWEAKGKSHIVYFDRQGCDARLSSFYPCNIDIDFFIS